MIDTHRPACGQGWAAGRKLKIYEKFINNSAFCL
jgi:hypothetical protein